MAELNVVQSAENLKAHQVPRHYSKSYPTSLSITTILKLLDGFTQVAKAPTSTGATQTPFLFLNVSGLLNFLEYAHKVSWAQPQSLIS
jgi:hypothetical protein